MDTTQPLNKILFLLDEISQCKQRLNIASDVTRDIEIALLQSKTIALYSEIQQYNHQALQPATSQHVPVNHYQATNPVATPPTPVKEKPAPAQTTYQAPIQQTFTAPKQETLIPEKQVQEEEKPKQQEQPVIAEAKPIEAPQPAPIQPQAPKKEFVDFEKKREKLLREEEEAFTTNQNSVSQPPVSATPKPAPQPEQEQQKPLPQQQPAAQQTTTQPQPEIQKPEPAKPNVSQLYAQAKERSASTGTEKSLNEKLATQQTSLNDKFQGNVKKNLADKLKLSPISDLRTAININQRVAFINHLFKGDNKEFKNVVSTVNGFKNFSEAKFYIQSDVAPRYSWNEQDENVQEFMELVYRKFL